MEGLSAGWVELPLTQSWRFGPAIADLASRVLAAFKGERRRLRGDPATPGSVIDNGWHTDTRAVLIRSNAGALQEILAVLEAGRQAASTSKLDELTSGLLVAYGLWLRQRPSTPSSPCSGAGTTRRP